ncbi:hypothetical protein MLD38_010904 [Melastoma candidum]|uniref:Uncharacterized protein n=1 Tax=Melastoma candidum TaxID=119954 RepID=A0ACB9R1C9_9MYRT|nr:hypothetical protein MLD38_010904 [Melastoma candidum]
MLRGLGAGRVGRLEAWGLDGSVAWRLGVLGRSCPLLVGRLQAWGLDGSVDWRIGEFKFNIEKRMSENGSGSSSRSSPALKRNTPKNALGARKDVGWERSVAVDNNPRIVKCMYCEKVVTGGIYRLNHHLLEQIKTLERVEQPLMM